MGAVGNPAEIVIIDARTQAEAVATMKVSGPTPDEVADQTHALKGDNMLPATARLSASGCQWLAKAGTSAYDPNC